MLVDRYPPADLFALVPELAAAINDPRPKERGILVSIPRVRRERRGMRPEEIHETGLCMDGLCGASGVVSVQRSGRLQAYIRPSVAAFACRGS